MKSGLRVGIVLGGGVLLVACAADAPVASVEVCRQERGTEAGLRVNAPSGAYFYADRSDGQQEGYALGGGAVTLAPGDYVARLNDTRHPVTVADGQVTVCETGTIDVAGTTGE